jgi:hypothetical protein
VNWYHPRMACCALCENVQPSGVACDVCGHPFPAAAQVDPPVEPLPDLEPTLLPGVEVLTEPVEGMEATAVDPVLVEAIAIEGLLPTAADGIPGADAASGPPAAVCRYCRTPGVPGEAFCAHCGMRLPVLGGAGTLPLEVVLCRDCGTPVRGTSCPACGVKPSR